MSDSLYAINGDATGGGGGGAPSGPAGGDLGGTYPDPTVTDLTIASEARGDLLRRGASAWQRFAAKTSGNVVTGDGTDVVSATIATVLAVSPAANRTAIGASASRRPAASATTRLLYELTQTSGAALNTGSLGASGDLSEIGSSVARSLDIAGALGFKNVMAGDGNSYIRGAAGLALSSTTTLTMWCLAEIRSDPASRKSIFTRDHATWGGWPYISAALVAAPSGAWYVEIGRVSPGYTEFHATAAYTLNRLHLFGLTYDGTTLAAWLDGVAAGTLSAAGEIDWGPGTGKWEIASNGGSERPVATIYRAGVEEAVWDASTWLSFARTCAGL